MVFIILHEEAYILRVLFQFTTRSVLNPNQTDNIYAMKHGSGGSKKELLAAIAIESPCPSSLESTQGPTEEGGGGGVGGP